MIKRTEHASIIGERLGIQQRPNTDSGKKIVNKVTTSLRPFPIFKELIESVKMHLLLSFNFASTVPIFHFHIIEIMEETEKQPIALL